MDHFICVHGHFYQPPRENPWLEAIELQDSAYPFHDWNERITAECYAPNAASRILDSQNRIIDISNNYAHMSFNFGPTLLSWMEQAAPSAYMAIINADRQSQQYFSGHGSAIAQAYNHIIMPLANLRDKYTQVRWGIKDFEARFGRSPEGMWLPETAVDLETLEALAWCGIRFTILAPHQAQRVRKIGTSEWTDVSGARVDPTMPYEIRLPSGRRLALYFYDGPISRAVAFEGLLANGERFANRLLGGFSETRERPQLLHIATDGETYGHHHRFGDMALAYALHHIEANDLARLTNYSEYLEICPPTHEVEIVERTAWSCAHGIERWRSDCGCNSGNQSGWSQSWRGPLRQSLDRLRDTLATPFEEQAGQILADPWAARDAYVQVVLDRSRANVDAFLQTHQSHPLSPSEQTRALQMLEMQRHLLLMYTSCGWFFDEISGIETVQCLQYAGRAMQLAHEALGIQVESRFIRMLQRAKSNVAIFGDGSKVYERLVKPAAVNLPKVAAHYAVSSLFEPYADRTQLYCYDVQRDAYRTMQAGHAKVAIGRLKVTSDITRESAPLTVGVVHLGDHNLRAGVAGDRDQQTYVGLVDEITPLFEQADLAQVILVLDKRFNGATYSLKSLFRDEQREILAFILQSTLDEAETTYRQVYEHHAPLMRMLGDIGVPRPRALQAAAELVLTTDLRREISSDDVDLDRVRSLLREARETDVTLDAAGLGHAMERTLERLVARLRAEPSDQELLERLDGLTGLIRELPFPVDLWTAQNLYWEVLHATYPQTHWRAQQGDASARLWEQRFAALGERLGVRVPQ
ncbi:MAG: hypothetical protein QOF51_2014 [Chloroflexota bacterium]|jgi:alpha-amylase/alpha-mannosidase (GH57 family)|nr:hypothetical protein [Chloroflexota bacterium]